MRQYLIGSATNEDIENDIQVFKWTSGKDTTGGITIEHFKFKNDRLSAQVQWGPSTSRSNNVNAPPLGSTRNSSTDRDDLGLMIAVQARDRLAFEKLYLGYYHRLTRFLTRFTRNLENIEEIVNDTFMVIWMRAKDFRHESKVSTWIMGIAYRTAMRKLRRQPHASSLQSVGDLPESSDPTTDIDTKDWLSCALARLPLEQRTTLTLAYQKGFSVKEIARITESPVGTVKSRLFHARVKLHEHALELNS